MFCSSLVLVTFSHRMHVIEIYRCEYLIQRRGLDYIQQVQRRRSHIRRRDVSRQTRQVIAGNQPRTNIRSQSTSFEPSSPPPDFQVFPPVSWEREDRWDPQGGHRVTYRAPGINFTTTRPGQTQEITNSTISGAPVNTRRRLTVTIDEAMRLESVGRVRIMQFPGEDSREDMERFVDK